MHLRLAIAPLIALALLRLALSPPVAAQEYHVRHYGVDDGLPSAQVRDLVQDGEGRMWFATRAGIASYDGRDWRTYSVADGLSWADQAALCQDPGSGLWSVSANAPFKVFTFEDDRWAELPGPASSPKCRVTSFEVISDPALVPLAAIGTDLCGLFVGRGDRWRQITRSDGLPDDHVVGLAMRGSGPGSNRLSIGTAGGLVELAGDPLVAPLVAVSGTTSLDNLRGLALERLPGERGVLWIVGDDWIGRLENRNFALVGSRLALPPPSDFGELKVRPDLRGGLYLADPASVAYYHPDHGLEILGRRNGLLADGGSSLWIDHEGNVWVGSRRGATKIISRRFARYSRRQGLLDDEVTAALERASGEIVLGHRGGISRLSDASVRTLTLTPPASRGGPEARGARRELAEPERVRDFAEDQRGNLWIAADSYGLARLDGAGNLAWFGSADGLHGPVTSVLAEQRGEGLWAGTEEGLFERRGASFEKVGSRALDTGEPEPIGRGASARLHVRRIFREPPGEAVLLATASGLHRFDGADFRSWTCGERSCNSVFAALPGVGGELWVGTAAGLYRTDGDALVPVAEVDFQDPIFFLVRDRQDRVWFGTDNGVARWDGRRLRRFTIRDGLTGRETHRAAGLVDSRGDVWIGSDRGVTVYSERRPGPKRAPPIVAISGVEVGGRRLELDEALELDSQESDLTFHFRAVSLIDEDRLQIRVRLEGADTDWSSLAPQDRQIRYSNLAPGSYRFALEAANADGDWSEVERSAILTIAHPYWQQGWFWVLLAAAGAGIFYSGQRLIAHRRYSRRLEAEVASRVEELRASEERYRHTFERSQAIMLLVEAETLEILDANRVACRFYGYPVEKLKGRSLDDLRVLQDRDSHSLDPPTQTGTHLLAEQHRQADGTVRDVELYSSATEIHGRTVFYVIVQDITELRLAEESTTAERARLAATLHHIDDGVITTDADGRILLLNRKAEEITGWPRLQAVGQPFRKVLRLYQESNATVRGPRLNLSVSAEALQPIPGAVLLSRSGQHKLVELSGSPIRKAGEISGLVLAFRDISERRHLENELAKSQRLEALGLLAGGIAHDFNNLLTVLLGNLSLIGRTLDDPDCKKNLDDAETAVLRARDLTQQLLTFSRGGAPIREAAAITEVISDSASFVLSGSKVRCEIVLPDDLRMVDIDAGQISQVINNLLINAMQAMPEGGVVTIRGENLDHPPSSLPAGRYVAIHVVDGGVGIPREHLPRIFDPYFSTKEKGRGLGLASAYSIAKQHDGLLTAASRPGRGATFSLYLPATEARRAAPPPPLAKLPAGHGRILVMDDEAEVRRVTRRMAQELGYLVDGAPDGEEALRLYGRALDRGEPYDLVIMDLTIPGGMGGQEAIRRLLALDPSARALVSSGYSTDPVLARHREHGFLGRIAKPFRIADLARALREALAQDSEVPAGPMPGAAER